MWEDAEEYSMNLDDLDDNRVTCAKINGEVVVTGHANGLICIWSRNEDLLMANDKCHYAEVTDIIFGDVYMNGPYTLNLDCPDEKPILVNGHFMVSTGLDGQVTTRSLKLSDHVSGKLNHKFQIPFFPVKSL